MRVRLKFSSPVCVPPPSLCSYKQHLQIYTVKAASVEEMEAKEKVVNERMPPSIKKFLQGNDVKVFVYSKPFRKDKQKNKENEFEVRPRFQSLSSACVRPAAIVRWCLTARSLDHHPHRTCGSATRTS
jgi:hypothetical protein